MKMKWMEMVFEKIDSQFHKEEFLTLCYSGHDYQLLNWISAHEFVLGNQWYDLVDQKKIEDGSYELIVFPDRGETEWFDLIFKVRQDHSSPNPNLIKQQPTEYYLFQDLITSLINYTNCKNQFCNFECWSSMNFNLKFYPPPRQV